MMSRHGDMELRIYEAVEPSLTRLKAIWDELGINGEGRIAREDVVIHHIQNLVAEMADEEQATKHRMSSNVDRYRSALNQLCQDLSLPFPVIDVSLPILQREKLLRLQVEELSKQRDERTAKMSSLSAADQKLCDLLCATPYYIPSGTVPTAEQLTELEDHIRKLETEKDKRRHIYQSSKRDIVKLLDDLELVPDTSFERDVVCDDEDSFLLTPDNMKQLKNFLDQLESKQESNARMASQLRDQVKTLWSRLAIPEANMAAFWLQSSGCKPKHIEALQKEVARCRQLKLQNIQLVVEAARTEIQDLWDKCYYSKEQREAFKPLYCDELTEDLLEIHDRELQNLRCYYEQNKALFDRVTRREQLWIKFLNFEQMASDPNRLFINRGCNLLKEEKARNKLQKELPQIEQEVAQEIARWEAATGNCFIIHGQTYTDYVATQWNEYKTKKEREKQQRLEHKAKQMEEEMKFGSRPVTPHKKRYAPSVTSGRTVTSKLRRINELEPASPWSAKRPAANPSSLFSPLCTTPVVRPHTKVAGGCGKPTDMLSTQQQSTVMRLPLTEVNESPTYAASNNRLHQPGVDSNDTGFSQTTVASGEAQLCDPDMTLAPVGHYIDFAGVLNENMRSNCRSSVLPSTSSSP